MSDYETQLRQMAGMQNMGMLGQQTVKLANANRPSPVIDQQMLMMDERLDVTIKLMCELEQRLNRVLHSVPTSPETPRDRLVSAPCTGVPLGDALATQGERLSNIQSAIRSILDRLEL
jgi:hypothetical protein